MSGEAGIPVGAEDRRYVVHREAISRSELIGRGWTEEELHTSPWPAAVHAYAVESGGGERPVAHVVHHSHDGFEYGHQRFKWQFIAGADRNASSFEISGSAIAAWVCREREAARSTPSSGGT